MIAGIPVDDSSVPADPIAGFDVTIDNSGRSRVANNPMDMPEPVALNLYPPDARVYRIT